MEPSSSKVQMLSLRVNADRAKAKVMLLKDYIDSHHDNTDQAKVKAKLLLLGTGSGWDPFFK